MQLSLLAKIENEMVVNCVQKIKCENQFKQTIIVYKHKLCELKRLRS